MGKGYELVACGQCDACRLGWYERCVEPYWRRQHSPARRLRNRHPKLAERFPIEPGTMCIYCRSQAATTRDHIVAISRGGRTDYRNLVFACAPCNQAKGDLDVEDFLLTDYARTINTDGVLERLETWQSRELVVPTYDVWDVAERFGVGPKTIRRWVKQGKLPTPQRQGQKYVWPRRTLNKFLSEQINTL